MIGSVRKRRVNRDGSSSYELRVSVDGRAYTRTVRCSSRAQAEREMARWYSSIVGGKAGGDSISWPDLCDRWLAEYAAMKYKASSFAVEAGRVAFRIKPAFRKKAAKVTRADVQAWVSSMAKELSPKSVKNCYALMRQIFAWAVRLEILPASPCEFIDLPKQKKAEPRFLGSADLPALLAALSEEERMVDRVLLSLALFAGLRKGEALGLCWSDLDLKKGTYTVVRTRLSNKTGGGWYVDTPKSETSVRRGALPGALVSLLKDYRSEQKKNQQLLGSSWPGGDWVVRLPDGTPLSPASVSALVERFYIRHGLPPFSLHSLRHTHATLLRFLGADLEEIQRRLGHSDKATTSNIYVHLFEKYEDLDRASASRLDAYLAAISD